MATSIIEQVLPINGVADDERSVYCKFPDGTILEWGRLTLEAGAYAVSRYMSGRFTTIHSVFVSPCDADVTAFAQKSSSSPNNGVTISRRPVTNENAVFFLVIGRWK